MPPPWTAQGDVYVTGQAGPGLPTTPGAFETSGSGAFVAKLNPTGTAVLYATCLGNGGGAGAGIAVDAAGDACVIGTDAGVPTTANAIASSAAYSSGSDTDFVAELNPTGTGLLYGTYLPNTVNYANELSYVSAIAVDGSGNIYVAGAGRPASRQRRVHSKRPSSGGQWRHERLLRKDRSRALRDGVLALLQLPGRR